MPLSSKGLCDAEIITPRSQRIDRASGSGNGAEQQHVGADRGEARDEGVFDHVARQARVLADDDAMAMIAATKGEAGRLADLHRHLARDLGVGPAANAVGAEILAPHQRASQARLARICDKSDKTPICALNVMAPARIELLPPRVTSADASRTAPTVEIGLLRAPPIGRGSRQSARGDQPKAKSRSGFVT